MTLTLSFSISGYSAADDAKRSGQKLTESEVDAAIDMVLVIGERLEIMSRNYITEKRVCPK